MLQPTGPQLGADELKLPKEPPDFELFPIEPNTEKAFSPRSLPHVGQISFTLAVLERTNFSYFSPQSWQTYS
jgi:hypothetical protein